MQWKNKWTDDINNVMLKLHSIFTGNFNKSFSNARKAWNVPEFECEYLKKIMFWRWCEYDIYIVTTSALGFKQLCIFCEFYPIKQIQLFKRIAYLAQIFNSSSQT